MAFSSLMLSPAACHGSFQKLMSNRPIMLSIEKAGPKGQELLLSSMALLTGGWREARSTFPWFFRGSRQGLLRQAQAGASASRRCSRTSFFLASRALRKGSAP